MEGELLVNGYGISVLDAEKVLDVYFMTMPQQRECA